MNNFQDKANFIWQIADNILRGHFKQHEYGDVILPFVVLRRLDCVLEPYKEKVITEYKKFKGKLEEEKLVNAVDFYEKMKKSLGSKRNYITEEQIKQISKIYVSYTEGEHCKIFNNSDFGYTKVVVERPLLENGKPVKENKGSIKPDTSLRDTESIPLKDDIDEYFEREVKPPLPDAWLDRSKDKIGYEINFTKYFYKYTPLRPLEEIKADILTLEKETEGLLVEILE
jgi:type I restriction enzyme M protein